MKHIICICISLLFLSSCGIPFLGGKDTEDSKKIEAATKKFEDNSISLSIPSSWEEIVSSNLPVPKSGDITLALKSPDISDGIYRTIVILEDTLLGQINSEQYARNDYKISVKKYSGFRELSEKDIKFADQDTGKLYTFEAKYNPDSPRMKFLQSSKICNEGAKNTVYNITIALPPSINELAKYEGLIKTLQCNKKEDS